LKQFVAAKNLVFVDAFSDLVSEFPEATADSGTSSVGQSQPNSFSLNGRDSDFGLSNLLQIVGREFGETSPSTLGGCLVFDDIGILLSLGLDFKVISKFLDSCRACLQTVR
jgi:hypothetical protein